MKDKKTKGEGFTPWFEGILKSGFYEDWLKWEL